MKTNCRNNKNIGCVTMQGGCVTVWDTDKNIDTREKNSVLTNLYVIIMNYCVNVSRHIHFIQINKPNVAPNG